MASNVGVFCAAALLCLVGVSPGLAQAASAHKHPPGSVAVDAPTGAPSADTVPELIHYRFDGQGTSVPNLASSPPSGTATATIMGGLTQTGTDLNLSGNGFSLVGSGASSTTDYLHTGWATDLGSGSWTISFASSNITSSTTLFYVFGDINTGSFRCFTNGVAGPNNWILRGNGMTDVSVPGGATVATHRTTFVYDMPAAEIRAYLDGVLVSTVPQGPLNFVGPGPFKVMGYSTNVGSPAGGLLDDFRVYNRALTALEVMDLDTALGELTITPAAVPFGDQLIETTSAPVSVTLANIGGAPLFVTALTAPEAPFELSGGSCGSVPINLPAGADCTLDYSFAPTVTGPFNQSLTVTSDAPGSGSIELSGTGVQGNLVIDPTDIDFGDVLVGSVSGEAMVTLLNDGTASLNVTSLTEATADFTRSGGTCSDTLPITLAVDESCTLGYTFSPSVTGLSELTLTVDADAPGSGSVELSGTGVQGILVIDPVNIQFGEVVVGSVSGESAITLSNIGTASLDVTSLTEATDQFSRSGGSCSDTLPITIASGGSCSLNYTFSPDATGLTQQTLMVTADAPGGVSIELAGTGVQGNLTVDPFMIDFGTLVVGEISALGTVTLGNNGDAELNVTSLTLADAPFARTTDGSCGNSLPIAIAANASCTLTYVYAPTVAGPVQQDFVTGSDAPGDPGFELSGAALPAENEIFLDGFEPFQER